MTRLSLDLRNLALKRGDNPSYQANPVPDSGVPPERITQRARDARSYLREIIDRHSETP